MHGHELGERLLQATVAASRRRAAGQAVDGDPEMVAWRQRVLARARARLRLRAWGGFGALSASIAAVAAATSSTDVAVVAGAVAVAGSARAATYWRRSRSQPADAHPPAQLPAPGAIGFAIVQRIAAAERSIEALTWDRQGTTWPESDHAAEVAHQSARELRDVARRLAAAQAARDSVRDPRARSALDGAVSNLVADLHDGAQSLEGLAAAVATVTHAPYESITGSHARVRDAVAELEARAEGIRAANRAFPPLN